MIIFNDFVETFAVVFEVPEAVFAEGIRRVFVFRFNYRITKTNLINCFFELIIFCSEMPEAAFAEGTEFKNNLIPNNKWERNFFDRERLF